VRVVVLVYVYTCHVQDVRIVIVVNNQNTHTQVARLLVLSLLPFLSTPSPLSPIFQVIGVNGKNVSHADKASVISACRTALESGEPVTLRFRREESLPQSMEEERSAMVDYIAEQQRDEVAGPTSTSTPAREASGPSAVATRLAAKYLDEALHAAADRISSPAQHTQHTQHTQIAPPRGMGNQAKSRGGAVSVDMPEQKVRSVSTVSEIDDPAALVVSSVRYVGSRDALMITFSVFSVFSSFSVFSVWREIIFSVFQRVSVHSISVHSLCGAKRLH
jgi:hypothetical protein